MREKSKQLQPELDELKTLILSNEKIIQHYFRNESNNYWIITHQLSGGGSNICAEKIGDHENFIASNCLLLYKRIRYSKNDELLKIIKLCSIIFFSIFGYQIQDENKAPDMFKNITGKSLIDIFKEPRQSKNKESIEQARKRAIEEPNLKSNLISGSIITLFICIILNNFYSGSDLYSFNVSIVIGIFLGLLGLEGHYHSLSKLAVETKFLFYLYRWKIRWSYFVIPSKLKFYFENKRMYIVLSFIIWYVMLLTLG